MLGGRGRTFSPGGEGAQEVLTARLFINKKRKGPSRYLQGHPASGENKQGREWALVLGRALEATVSAALAVTLDLRA